jgi:NAD(P)-dependent dehydrogenase (short-subunit alcohol dehydrogenase family)
MVQDRFNLTGKVALITGSGRGIGLAIGEALAEAGASVVLQDIELPVAQAAAKAINDRGGRAVAFGGDICDMTLPAKLVKDAVSSFGGLHILVNNASIQSFTKWLELDLATIQQQVNADIVSPMLFCKEVVPILKAQKFGRIINIGSIQQSAGDPNMLPYCVSKGALMTMTRTLARELARDGITVNSIAPGFMRTFRNMHYFPDDDAIREHGKRSVPLGRIGEGSDCAGAALLLCSAAGEYITGQSINVDGGMSAR